MITKYLIAIISILVSISATEIAMMSSKLITNKSELDEAWDLYDELDELYYESMEKRTELIDLEFYVNRSVEYGLMNEIEANITMLTFFGGLMSFTWLQIRKMGSIHNVELFKDAEDFFVETNVTEFYQNKELAITYTYSEAIARGVFEENEDDIQYMFVFFHNDPVRDALGGSYNTYVYNLEISLTDVSISTALFAFSITLLIGINDKRDIPEATGVNNEKKGKSKKKKNLALFILCLFILCIAINLLVQGFITYSVTPSLDIARINL